jgi:hypothetical protein
MPTGILGQSSPAATTNTTVYTVPAGKVGTFNISATNTAAGSIIACRIAIAATGTPAANEFIEYDTLIPANGVLERGGVVANAGENVVVYASLSGLSVSVYGYEE